MNRAHCSSLPVSGEAGGALIWRPCPFILMYGINANLSSGEAHMDTEVLVAVSSNVTTVAVAIVGWFFALKLHRDLKAQERLQGRLNRLEKELLARIELEETTSDWIAEITSRPVQAVKSEARDRAEKKSDSRPTMSRSDLNNAG